MNEIGRLHGDNRRIFARRGVDLVFVVVLEFRNRNDLDRVCAGRGGGIAAPLAVMPPAAAAPAPAAPSGRGLVFGCLRGERAALLGGLFLEQRLAVRDWNLVIVGVNFSKSQEAVAIASVIDEGRLQRRFYARHFGKINIASELLLVC